MLWFKSRMLHTCQTAVKVIKPNICGLLLNKKYTGYRSSYPCKASRKQNSIFVTVNMWTWKCAFLVTSQKCNIVIFSKSLPCRELSSLWVTFIFPLMWFDEWLHELFHDLHTRITWHAWPISKQVICSIDIERMW